MYYYFAPMDGITDNIYRKLVWKHFPYWDKLYAPFIQPNDKPVIVPKEEYEVHPDNNRGIPVVPQILTCDAKGFIKVGKILEEYGYDEINLNLGCPAKIIVSKGKGAGMLADTYDLNVFFDEIFNNDWKVKITVKSRLGLTENADFIEIMETFSRYPIDELTIHPRFRTDFYNGKPRLEEFDKVFSVLEKSPNKTMKVCYNGNVNTIKDVEYIIKRYPTINSIMLGRGALANPAIIRIIKGGKKISKGEFKSFHDDIFNSYYEVGFKDKILMYKMKEMWNYWSDLVDCNIDVLRRLRLSENVEQYDIVMNEIYENWKLKDNNGIV